MGPKCTSSGASGAERRLGYRRAGRRVIPGTGAVLLTALALATTSVAPSPAGATIQALHRRMVAVTTTTTSTATGPAATTTVPPKPLPQSPPPAGPDTCVKGAWPSQYEGRPATFAASGDGAYLWHDVDGAWALRVTHSGPRVRVIFSGSLYSATGQFEDVALVGTGGNDIVFETANKHSVYFRFVDDGWVDGLNFATSCAKAFTVNIHQGPRLASPSEIYLGASSVNPVDNPFRVTRVRGDDGADGKVTGVKPSTTTTTATTTTTVAG
jgi:hypothetical protein